MRGGFYWRVCNECADRPKFKNLKEYQEHITDIHNILGGENMQQAKEVTPQEKTEIGLMQDMEKGKKVSSIDQLKEMLQEIIDNKVTEVKEKEPVVEQSKEQKELKQIDISLLVEKGKVGSTITEFENRFNIKSLNVH